MQGLTSSSRILVKRKDERSVKDSSLEILSNVDDISIGDSSETFRAINNRDELQRLHIENASINKSADIVRLINQRDYLRELSIYYGMLSEDVVFALCNAQHLTTVRIEAQSDVKSLPRIAKEAWYALENHSPNLNIVLTCYLSDEEDYDDLLATYVPLTHLYLGGEAPAPLVVRISENCPRLVELVVDSYEAGVIDSSMIAIANSCPRLSTLGLGDCEITCSGLIDFVSRCHERLRLLCVWETSLVEDVSGPSIAETTTEITRLLGRSWTPEYVPPW